MLSWDGLLEYRRTAVRVVLLDGKKMCEEAAFLPVAKLYGKEYLVDIVIKGACIIRALCYHSEELMLYGLKQRWVLCNCS